MLAVFVLLAVGVAPASAEMAFERKWGATPDGTFRTASAVAADAAGTVYVADYSGRVQAFSSTGTFLRKWGSRGPAAGQLAVPYVADLTTDAAGNVYTAEPNGARVQKFAPTGAHLQTFGTGAGSADGQLSLPMGVAVDAQGNVYVADYYNHRVQKFDASGAFVTRWGTQGAGQGQFSLPEGIAVAPDGSVFVADTQNSRIQKFGPDGTYLAQFTSGLARPKTIEIDDAGTLYVQTASTSIHKFSAAGLPLGTVGSQGTGDGQFARGLNDHAVAGGHVYAVDNEDRIQKFTQAGAYVTRWGRPAGTADGELRSLAAIAASADGRVYVADSDLSRINEFTTDGTFVRKWGTVGTGDGQLSNMAGIAVGTGGDVYVAAANRVQQFTAAGTHVRTWGGPGTATGQFSGLRSLAVDAGGNVYTLEETTSRVQKFTSSGAFVTSFTWSGPTGPNEHPRPIAIAVASDGNVYVGHGGNRFRIDRFAADGTPLSPHDAPNLDALTADARQHLFTIDFGGRVHRRHVSGVGFEQVGRADRSFEDGSLYFPRGVAASGQSLYVADSGSWRVQKFTENDIAPPETTITLGPSGRVNTAGASLTFASSDDLSRYECRIDEGEWELCGSSHFASSSGTKSYASLSEGQHTFAVKAVDEAGNEDPTPASRSFFLDRTPPETAIDSGPSGPTNASTVEFAFSSDDAGASFECRLDTVDGEGFWQPCTSAQRYTGLVNGPYTFHVRGKDQAANPDASPATRSFTIDRVAPDTTIDSGPSGATSADPVGFTFSSPDTTATFECRLDTGATVGTWDTCASPRSLAALAEGFYVLRVRARDAAGNVDASPATRSFTIDRTAPETTIGSGPDGPTNAEPVTFGFSASGASGYDCRLDAGGTDGTWEPCTSARSFASLSQGAYTFNVRAKDAAGNVDASPATRSFTVDRTAPETAIDSGPSGPTNAEPLTFELSSTGGATLVECRLTRDGVAGTWETCPSTKTFTTLSEASYVLEARARDAAGNADATPAARSFVVDRTAPETTIDSGPTGPTNAEPAVFAFSATGGATGFECRLDAGATPGAWQPCTSTRSLAALADGAYTFNVRAKDAAGNADASPATRSFVVDRTAPETAITSGPTGATNADPISFGLTSGDATATFECRLDRNALVGEWGACATPRTLAGLTDASYVLNVRAVDTAGNRDATPATRSFTVDRAAPDTALTSGPSGATNADLIAFAFNTTDGAATFECRLDTETTPGAWLPCSSTRSFSGLDDGVYTFNVRAKDALGNADASPATRSFTLDRTAPETTLSSGPSGTVTSTSATFTFSSPENGSRFECRLDGGPWAPCASSVVYDGLSVATHVVDVRALDALGNADATPASRTWTVASPPSSGSSGPSGTSGPGPSGSSGQSGSQASNGAEQSGHDVGLTLAGTKVRGGRAVRLAIACGEACPALSASASVKIAGTRKALPVGGARVAAGERAVTLKLSKRTREAVKRALARKRRVTLTVRVMGLQPGGGVLWTKRQTLTLKRL